MKQGVSMAISSIPKAVLVLAVIAIVAMIVAGFFNPWSDRFVLTKEFFVSERFCVKEARPAGDSLSGSVEGKWLGSCNSPYAEVKGTFGDQKGGQVCCVCADPAFSIDNDCV